MSCFLLDFNMNGNSLTDCAEVVYQHSCLLAKGETNMFIRIYALATCFASMLRIAISTGVALYDLVQ